MSIKQSVTRVVFSCDGLKGFLINYPESFLLSSRINILRLLGGILTSKRKVRRLKIIEKANEPQISPLLISIILPALNAEETIAKTVSSIQGQSYPHWELIIINDGSIDTTQKLISKFSQRDSRIEVYKNKICKGAAYARNVGLFYAKGDYITFHDADDTSHPERLEYLLATMVSNRKIEITVSQYMRVNTKSQAYILNGRKKRNYISGMMFKKEIIEKVGFFKSLKISEDSEYYERIVATYGKPARRFICKTLYYALFSPDSLLFSNADVTVNGLKLDYTIHDNQREELESCRRDHKKIHIGQLSPYQPFTIDNDITVHLNSND